MTQEPHDPLGVAVGRGNVPRDGRDHALLYPKGLEHLGRVPYTSASSLSDFVSNFRGISIWEKRYLARGLGMREDLAALAGAEVYSTGFDEPDKGTNKESGRRLDEIIARALESARIHERADYGTAAHQLTEPGQREAGGYTPERMVSDVEEMDRVLRGVQIVATEVFVANDHWMAAGTFDHLVRCEGFDGLLILDKKFGRNIKPGPWSVQTVVYGDGEIYGTGEDLDRRWTFEEKYGTPVNKQWGLIASVPARSGRGALIPIDLSDGRTAAEHAVWVRDWQKRSDQMKTPLNHIDLARRRAEALLADCTTAPELSAVYREFRDVWTDRLTALGQSRLTH